MSDLSISPNAGDVARKMAPPQMGNVQQNKDIQNAQAERNSANSVEQDLINAKIKKVDTQDAEVKDKRSRDETMNVSLMNELQQELDQVDNEPEKLQIDLRERLKEIAAETVVSARRGGIIIDVEI
ncbi:MAG: DUF244 domain-containing protein [Porticoccaceae bacterium]|jgi:hypothetical protein|nr:MAG: hypothetical protein ABS23_01890 [SAR92 bacterium BACL16 MAG-120619-bin48]MDO7634375.1 DUF244 domain-containing protein [Porticoccaceae bacterium]MDP4654188.1 DUF244 domain-containing protein [Alphaproteobacteria bacterium]MDP4744526.1 DUF244 domain-containing protein [Porticoccaceae bacterium]MDP4751713.1 DUF244 domain-containing protein [Porticoccaceae bacterium]